MAEISIFNEIGNDTAQQVSSQLRSLGGRDLTVVITSGGGNPYAAFAIADMLKAHSGRITTRVAGIAASAASLIAVSGDTVVMGEDSFLMLHNPAVEDLAGRHEGADLRSVAEMLDKMQERMAHAYARKSGKPVADMQRLMTQKSYLTATEAVEWGLADEIEQEVALAASIDPSRLADAPAALVARLRQPLSFADFVAEYSARHKHEIFARSRVLDHVPDTGTVISSARR